MKHGARMKELEQMPVLTEEEQQREAGLEPALARIREDFVVYLSVGDYNKCLDITLQFTGTKEAFMKYCQQIVQPCMHEIGKLWEEGGISSTQANAATSMVERFISYLYAHLFISGSDQPTAMVITAPNEHHELGARVVADFLEIHGWNVVFYGAKQTNHCLEEKIRQTMPKVLFISVTMFSNIRYAEEIITNLRKASIQQIPKIIVGGQAFFADPHLWKVIGADGAAVDATEAVERANESIHNLQTGT